MTASRLIPGLVSVTFRQLSPEEIIPLVKTSGLQSIEWGGDVHVPPGDVRRAGEVGRLTREAGLRVASYGSYYRVGLEENKQPAFVEVLATAVALGAPTIRVWAGETGSRETDENTRARIVAETRRIAALAENENITLSLEYHGETLTDTNDSAVRLLEEVAHSNVFSYWQPRTFGDFAESYEGLQRLLPYLSHVHAFHWTAHRGLIERHPFREGIRPWRHYLHLLGKSLREHHVLIEFVRHDQPDVFLEDAATLREWLAAGELRFQIFDLRSQQPGRGWKTRR